MNFLSPSCVPVTVLSIEESKAKKNECESTEGRTPVAYAGAEPSQHQSGPGPPAGGCQSVPALGG